MSRDYCHFLFWICVVFGIEIFWILHDLAYT